MYGQAKSRRRTSSFPSGRSPAILTLRGSRPGSAQLCTLPLRKLHTSSDDAQPAPPGHAGTGDRALGSVSEGLRTGPVNVAGRLCEFHYVMIIFHERHAALPWALHEWHASIMRYHEHFAACQCFDPFRKHQKHQWPFALTLHGMSASRLSTSIMSISIDPFAGLGMSIMNVIESSALLALPGRGCLCWLGRCSQRSGHFASGGLVVLLWTRHQNTDWHVFRAL